MSRGKWNKIILSDDQLNQIKIMFGQGLGVNRISKALGLSKSLVYKQGYNKLGLTGTERKPATINLTKQQLKLVQQLFNQGMGERKIAENMGFSRNVAKLAMKRLGLSNVGRKITKKSLAPTERKCRACEITKSMEHFYKRVRSNGRVEFSYNCIKCSRQIRITKHQTKRNTDPLIRLRDAISTAIRIGLQRSGGHKNNQSILQYLPYSIQELKEHLEKQFEPWMNWKNQGQYDPKTWNDNESAAWTWQVDHIIPHSTFKYTSIQDEEFKKCWALSNLRPLSAKQNLLDGTNKTRHNKLSEQIT